MSLSIILSVTKGLASDQPGRLTNSCAGNVPGSGKTAPMRSTRGTRQAPELSARIGVANNAQRITVNLSGEIGDELRRTALRCSVSESSIVEVALRQLFRRFDAPTLSGFLLEQGACLRRRRDGTLPSP
jgi:hypothetical protein